MGVPEAERADVIADAPEVGATQGVQAVDQKDVDVIPATLRNVLARPGGFPFGRLDAVKKAETSRGRRRQRERQQPPGTMNHER
jgi:hypothetical protein